MLRYALILVATFTICQSANAQYFLGLRGSPYGGVTNVDYNPAIAHNRFVVDINIIGVASSFSNNYVGIDRRTLYHPGYFNDANFQQDYLRERINGRYKFAEGGSSILGPLSFMVSFGKKKDRNKNAIAFTWHNNAVGNIDHVTEMFARIAYYGAGSTADAVTHFVGQNLNSTNMSAKAAMWNDYGITYSRVVYQTKNHMVIVGGTLKLIQPIAGVYSYVNNLNYQWPEYEVLSINKSSVGYGYSQGLITSQGFNKDYLQNNGADYVRNLFSFKNSPPTAAVDMGVVYQWQPIKKTLSDMDCQASWWEEINRYKLAAGFSIMDFGALRFNRGPLSENFYADVQGWDVSHANFPDGIQSIDDTIHSKFLVTPTKSYVNIWLPTRFNMFIDYVIVNDFAVTFNAMVSPDMSPNHNMLHYVSNFSLTPKYDSKWIGVYIPVSCDVYGNFGLGATLRIGPLIIGTNDILAFVAKKYVYNADIHAALKITIPEHRHRFRGDIRFTPDKEKLF